MSEQSIQRGTFVQQSKVSPVDLSEFLPGSDLHTIDRDRQYRAGSSRYGAIALVATQSIDNLHETAIFRANPNATCHPLAAQIGLRLVAANGELV